MPAKYTMSYLYGRMQHYNPFTNANSPLAGTPLHRPTPHYPPPGPPPGLPPRHSTSPHRYGKVHHDERIPNALLPLSGPLGVFPAYTQHQNEALIKLAEKTLSWSGDDFIVHSATGSPLFQVRGKKFTLHSRKEFRDASGTPLFTLSKRMLALHSTFDALDARDERHVLFTIKKNFSIGRADLSVTFFNRCGHNEEVEFKLRGHVPVPCWCLIEPPTGTDAAQWVGRDWFDRKAEVTYNGTPVARISRSFINARELLADKQTYYLSVAPGVDTAMMVALCVCLDETENDKTK